MEFRIIKVETSPEAAVIVAEVIRPAKGDLPQVGDTFEIKTPSRDPGRHQEGADFK